MRESVGLPVLHASKVDDVATARHAIREGKVDLVAILYILGGIPAIVAYIVLSFVLARFLNFPA